jgi:predicted nucleic acid-binding protein
MSVIIVDTNIIFSVLLREQSKVMRILLESEHDLYICELILMELFKHKEKIVKMSQLSEHDFIKLYYAFQLHKTI